MRAKETQSSAILWSGGGDFTVAIVCFPCGPRRSLIYACEWGFWVCWKFSAAEQIKPDCCHTPAVVSILLTPLPVSCPSTTPLHYSYIRDGSPGWSAQLSHSSWALFDWWWWWCRASCPQMSVDMLQLLGTKCDQCLNMVQCCFTSMETIRLIRTGSRGQPPRLSHSSWTLILCV